MQKDNLKEQMNIVYARYYREVYAYCMKLTEGNHHDAEELAQNAFYKAINSSNSFRGECSVKSFICQIAKNDFISNLRKSKRFQNDEQIEQKLLNMDNGKESVEMRFENQEKTEAILRALEKMKEPYRTIFRMKVIEEKSYLEIASVYGKSEGFVRVTYYRAKQRLVEEMCKNDWL